MRKLVVKEDHILAELYKFGEDDTFDFWYYRVNDAFSKNKFYKTVNTNGYDNENYSDIEKILINANIIKDYYKIVIPRGEWDLIEYEDKWDLNINDVRIDLVNLLDENNWTYNEKIKNIMYIK